METRRRWRRRRSGLWAPEARHGSIFVNRGGGYGSGGQSPTWPHEPGGFVVMMDEPFTASPLPGDGQVYNGQWNYFIEQSDANSKMTIDSGEPAGGPVSSGSGLKIALANGWVSGNSNGFLDNNTGNWRNRTELFVGLAFYVQSPFQAHSSGVQKLFYISCHSGGNNDFWLEFGNAAAPFEPQIVLEFLGLASQQAEANITNSLSTPVTGEVQRTLGLGSWHKLELYLKQPAVSGNPGTVTVWADGLLAITRTPSSPANAQIPMSFDSGWVQIAIDPIWGGVTDTKSENDAIWYDHLYVSAPS